MLTIYYAKAYAKATLGTADDLFRTAATTPRRGDVINERHSSRILGGRRPPQ
jgi:hypothetical protein